MSIDHLAIYVVQTAQEKAPTMYRWWYQIPALHSKAAMLQVALFAPEAYEL